MKTTPLIGFVVLASSLVAQSQYATNPKRSLTAPFDTPLKTSVVDLGPSSYYPVPNPPHIRLSCFFFSGFFVKAYDEGQKGAEWLSIVPITKAANSSTIKVWVNTDSGVYHCPGARWYGKTKAGAFMEQREAQQKGYKPASGKTCGSASASSTSENEAIQNSLGAQCGFERWPVKVLTDRDRALVDFKPADTTVTALNNLKRHNTYPYDRRVNDEELRVYRVRARLVEMHDAADSDLHLVIAEPDQPDVSMIAEIPASFCALGSGHETDYETARADARGIAVGSLIEIAGVGFFDTIHRQTGVARNGFELHPVLRIRALQAP